MRFSSLPFPGRRRAAAALLALGLLAACGQEGTTVSSSGTASTGTGGDGSGGQGGSDLPPVPVTIVDWNTHNFFDTLNDNPNGDVLTKAQYTKKRQTIGAELAKLAGDIVILCEVENKNILVDLNKTELGGAYSSIELIAGNDTRGIDIGLLSKIKPDAVISHKDEFFQSSETKASYQYSRDCLELHFTINGRKLVVLGVHFKAKEPTDSPDKRLAEAEHTRALADAITKKDPTTAVLILGDMNDTPGTPPLKAVVGKAPALYKDSADAAPDAERYSFVYQGTKELIDHQMANPVMAGLLDPASVHLPHGAGIDDKSAAASDHAPIRATYLIK
jgi:endonuclease/exonuclease/phosphatase family metal-dependent hydrolase